MTYSDHRKVFKQLRAKPVKLAKFRKHNAPKKRSCGFSLMKCTRCGKYGLNVCRQCFREIATQLGFKKYS